MVTDTRMATRVTSDRHCARARISGGTQIVPRTWRTERCRRRRASLSPIGGGRKAYDRSHGGEGAAAERSDRRVSGRKWRAASRSSSACPTRAFGT